MSRLRRRFEVNVGMVVLALLIVGAILGVIVPWAADGSLRLAGLGLPSGLILGVVVYLTLDLLLIQEGRTQPPAEQAAAAPGQVVSAGSLAGGRRQHPRGLAQ